MQSRQSLADLLADMNLMAEAIEKRLESLNIVSVTQEDADLLRAQIVRLRQLQSEQDALNAAKKTKTAELRAQKTASRRKRANLKNRIKLVIPQTEWVAFGIRGTK